MPKTYWDHVQVIAGASIDVDEPGSYTIQIERDNDRLARYRVRLTIEDKDGREQTVTHIFDMGVRWFKRFGWKSDLRKAP